MVRGGPSRLFVGQMCIPPCKGFWIFRGSINEIKEGEEEEIIFFYGKVATLSWDPDRWCWVEGFVFLTIPRSSEETLSST
jgi:hypothetical protein